MRKGQTRRANNAEYNMHTNLIKLIYLWICILIILIHVLVLIIL